MQVRNLNSYYNKLKEISAKIYFFYDALRTLELEGKENTNEYEKILKKIEFYKSKEASLYSIISGDDKIPLSNMLLLLISQDKDGIVIGCDFYDPKVLIFNELESQEFILMRIESILDALNDHGRNNRERKRNKVFIDFIDDTITDPSYKKYKNALTKAKYDFSFVLDDSIYCDPEETNLRPKTVSFGNEIIAVFSKMAPWKKEDFDSDETARSALLSQAYIRANLLYMDKSSIEKLEKAFDSSIMKKMFSNSIASQTLEYLFDNSQSDKEKSNSISRVLRKY